MKLLRSMSVKEKGDNVKDHRLQGETKQEKPEKPQQEKEKSWLTKYGINYDPSISFVPSKKKTKDNRTMLMLEKTFQEFVEIVKPFSLKAAYLMVVYKKVNLGHKPYVLATFRELAEELGTTDEVLRRYSKNLKKDELLHYEKLKAADARVKDQYIFQMGPKFQNYVWRSKLFDIIKKDQNVVYVERVDGQNVDNSGKCVDNSDDQEEGAVHNGLSNSSKQSTTDCTTVHNGLPRNFQFAEIIELARQKSPPVFSLSSINMSSVSEKSEETNVSIGNGIKKRKPTTAEKYNLSPEQFQKLQFQWSHDTQGTEDFGLWLQRHGLGENYEFFKTKNIQGEGRS